MGQVSCSAPNPFTQGILMEWIRIWTLFMSQKGQEHPQRRSHRWIPLTLSHRTRRPLAPVQVPRIKPLIHRYRTPSRPNRASLKAQKLVRWVLAFSVNPWLGGISFVQPLPGDPSPTLSILSGMSTTIWLESSWLHQQWPWGQGALCHHAATWPPTSVLHGSASLSP